MTNSITVEEYLKQNKNSTILIDVRDSEELNLGKIENSIHIPFDELSYNIEILDKNKKIFIYCKTGKRSEDAVKQLTELGYDAYSIEGGYEKYKKYIDSLDAVIIDAKGEMCPGPIIKVADTLKDLRNGQRVYVEATEDAFESDIQIWAERTGNKFVQNEHGRSRT